MDQPDSGIAQYFRQINTGRENKFYLALFLIVMLGGAIRKWVTDSSAAGNLVLFAQMMVPFAMFFFRSNTAVSPFQKFPLLYPFFGYMAFHIIYPLQVTPFHGMLGMIVHGLFWMGAFFYLSNRRLFNPSHYLPLIFVFVAGEIILAFVQYALPGTNVLNKYSSSDIVKQVAVVNDKVRVSGTFSYLSGFTAFLLFYPFFIWALIRKNYNTWIVAFAAAFGMIASFMTGSRSGTLLFVAFTSVLLIQSYKISDLGKIFARLIIPVAFGLMVILLSKKIPLVDQIETAYNNFSDRVTQNRERGEEKDRIFGDLYWFEGNHFKYPILGIGIGSTYQGATILFGESPLAKEFGYVESEFVKTLLEGGIILIFFKIALATIVVLNAALPSKLIKGLTWITLLYAAPIVYNVHNAAFLLLGIMLVDNIVWRQQVEERWRREQDFNEPVPQQSESTNLPVVSVL